MKPHLPSWNLRNAMPAEGGALQGFAVLLQQQMAWHGSRRYSCRCEWQLEHTTADDGSQMTDSSVTTSGSRPIQSRMLYAVHCINHSPYAVQPNLRPRTTHYRYQL